jgi:peroxiredoxin Q/BCP
VIGISADSVSSHERFIEKKELNFDLISDSDKKILNLFGVFGPKKFMGREYDGIHRTTFIMNEKNEIIEIIRKPNTKNHAEEILAAYKRND